jgi:hypothetical protein
VTASTVADPSTRPLSEVARHLIVPSGIVDTLWFEVEVRCREFGDEFDAWQDGLGQVVLGLRADGTFAATVGGITLSIPRQVAKTFIVMRIVVALCTLFPNLTVLWTAHRTRTATNTFQKMKALVLRPAVRGYLRPGSNQGTAIRDANGEQEIPFANGSRILFGAREQGFGRGFDEVDVEVFDEAQILTDRALEDMVAATNQSRFPYGALLFFMGTPPRPVDPGEAFTLRREEALTLKPEGAGFGELIVGGDAVYIECSADPDADPDDREQWAKANASYPHRTPLRSMLRLRKNLPGLDSWRREALGIWDELGGAGPVIDAGLWATLNVPAAPPDGVVSYGVKFSPDGESVALAAAVRPEFGPIHVEGIDHRPLGDGTRWLVDWLASRKARVVVDGKSGAGAFVSALRKRGVPDTRIIRPTLDEVIAAHAAFVQAALDREVSHLDDPVLASSVAAATRRPIGKSGGWGFSPLDGGDVTLVEAVLLARWGAASRRSAKAPSERRAVVL